MISYFSSSFYIPFPCWLHCWLLWVNQIQLSTPNSLLDHQPGTILCMRRSNERRRYIATPSLICWAHTQNDFSQQSIFHTHCIPHTVPWYHTLCIFVLEEILEWPNVRNPAYRWGCYKKGTRIISTLILRWLNCHGEGLRCGEIYFHFR